MNKLSDKMKRYSFLPLVLLALLFLQLTDETANAEDLVLSATDVMVIENTTHVQKGNIIIRDDAKLTIRNATLILDISYHEEFGITVLNRGSLDISGSTITSSLPNEAIGIMLMNESKFILQSSTGDVGIMFGEGTVAGDPGRDVGYHGTASISGANITLMGILLTPTGGTTISVSNSAINQLSLEFNNSFEGEFSDLRPGLFTSWAYTENGNNITFTDTTVNLVDVCPMGPATVIIRNSELFTFFLQAPLPTIWMQAIDSVIETTGFFLADSTKASFWGLKPGFMDNWKLREHSTGDSLPEMIFTNTEIKGSWGVMGGWGAELNIDDSFLGALNLYSGNTDITVTNSTVDRSIMFYSATNSSVHLDNTVVRAIDVYVPPNSVTITGNVTFMPEAQIKNWYSPSEITRTYEVVVKNADGPIEGASLSLYSIGDSLIWSGTTDVAGKAIFTVNFTDTNYTNVWRLEATHLGVKRQKEIGLLTSTPVEMLFYPVTPSVFDGTMGTEITFTDPPSGFGNDKGRVLIGGITQKVDNWSNTSIKVIVKKPPPSQGTAYDVSIQPKPKETSAINLPGGFTTKSPALDPLQVSFGSPGKEITITGKFFSTKKGKVYLEDLVTGKKKNCKIISWSMEPASGQSTLTFVVPKLPKGLNPGTYPLKVSNKVGTAQTTFFVEP